MAKAAQLALGDRAVAVTGTSASLAVGELDESIGLARQIGIRHEVIQTDELAIPGYQENTANRCYFCKTELFREGRSDRRTIGRGRRVRRLQSRRSREHRPGSGPAGSGRLPARWPSAG